MQPIVLIDHIEAGSPSSEDYIFKGAMGKCHWPKLRGKGLGRCGIWNFLWRLGFHPQQLSIAQLPAADHETVLFVDKTNPMDAATQQRLNQWMQQGGKIVATGELESWHSFLPQGFHWQTSFSENPYAGCAYLLEDYVPQLIAPPNWSFIEYEGDFNHNLFSGNIAAVQGERQTPARALLKTYKNAPAIIHHHSFYYLNSQPFSAFQAWLQGQEDLSPWLSWRHRLFWLDEWISFFCDLMFKLEIFKAALPKPGIPTLNKQTIILRHDLDHTRDTTFLAEADKRNIKTTYAFLKDRNTKFWINTLQQSTQHEIAFHYNTGKRNWRGIIHRLLTKQSRFGVLPYMRQIKSSGLLKQVTWAKQQGVDIKTLHRHLCYLIYPEWIDAMDTVFENEASVLGGSSLFRAQVLKWGIDIIEGQYGFLGEWPDAQFPVWYPFKLAHAGKNGKILKGWEMTALMEIEPELLVQLLDYNIKHIQQNVFTLIFHPAHANQPSLYKHGSLNYFKSILDILTKRNIDIIPMYEVLQHANASFGIENNDQR